MSTFNWEPVELDGFSSVLNYIVWFLSLTLLGAPATAPARSKYISDILSGDSQWWGGSWAQRGAESPASATSSHWPLHSKETVDNWVDIRNDLPSVPRCFYMITLFFNLPGLSGARVLALQQRPPHQWGSALPGPVRLHSQQPSDPRQSGQVLLPPSLPPSL